MQLKMSRFSSRVLLFSNVLKRIWKHPFRNHPKDVKRILIAHHLLLGDTIMLTPLIAKAREQFPNAEIILLTPKAITGLYDKKPYGVIVKPYDPKDIETLKNLLNSTGYDLAFIPGDNRYSWLAYALGSKWIKAFAEDKKTYKSWPVDELIPYSNKPANWADMNTDLINGPAPQPYNPEDWPAPSTTPYEHPEQPYCVLHVGASTPLKMWPAENWQNVAQNLSSQGFQVVWSAGKNEKNIVDSIDPNQTYKSYAEKLDLTQLWDLILNAKLLISPDTGIAHIGKITNTPTITIFGPGSATICGAGKFWQNASYNSISPDNIKCKNQNILFNRTLPWVQRCGRSVDKCSNHICMKSVTPDMLANMIKEILDHQYL